MVKTRLLALCALIGLALGHGLAHAARVYTNVQTPTAASAVFDMGSTQSLSYRITNTNTGTNTGERIFEMRFRVLTGSSLFSGATAAPAGWTRTAWSTTAVTFQATSWANAIVVGGASVSFTLVLTMRSSNVDISETLRDLRARYTKSTGGPPFSSISAVVTNKPDSWTLKSLTITSFQITDTLGSPISSLAAGGNFRLVMTVKNNSTSPQNAIVSNPNPPTTVETGTVTQSLTGTVTSPSPFNLASLASGTITFSFSTAGSDNGTIYFTAQARVGTSVTSNTATSPILTFSSCVLSGSFQLPASSICQYAGSNITLRMALKNNCTSPINTVTPALNPPAGPVTLVSGPTPATIGSIAVGATATVDWVYQINNSAATNPFTFVGSATSLSPALTAPAATSPGVTRGEFPIAVNPLVTNASSSNVEMTWTPTNNGCAAVNSVAISIPAGWVWANDAYSLVDLSAINSVETWVASGANPVTFTAPNVANRLPQSFGGDFSLVFSATPASTTTSNFTVNVTDANGAAISVAVPVTVSPFKDPNGLNSVTTTIWREQIP
jgi:hypothetical protein